MLPEERFWAKVDCFGPDDCWPWTAGKRLGYGRLYVAGRKETAHRLAYALAVGPIPEGLCVLHRCDNPGCCNPAHLFLGTQADNVADMEAKGRAVHRSARPGEGHHAARLNAAQAIVIRAATGMSQRALAREYGVCQQTISDIVRRRRWAHLSEGEAQHVA